MEGCPLFQIFPSDEETGKFEGAELEGENVLDDLEDDLAAFVLREAGGNTEIGSAKLDVPCRPCNHCKPPTPLREPRPFKALRP